MSKLSLDLMINEKQLVIDLPKPMSTCFLELGNDIQLLSISNCWESGRVSRTKSHRRAFYKTIKVCVSIGSDTQDITFTYIGAGANRIVYRNNALVLKISTIPISKLSGRSWDDPTVVERTLTERGIVGVLPALLEGEVPLSDSGESYFFQCQPFADMTLDMVFSHMVSDESPGDVDLRQLFGFLFSVAVNIIHIFRENTKLDIILGGISSRNVSLAHGALKIIDWEACPVIAPGESGFAPHASKFLQLLLRDIAQQFPPQSNAQAALAKVSSELTHPVPRWKFLSPSRYHLGN